MRSDIRLLFAAAAAAGLALTVAAGPASAEARDHVYADSFGNLVIQSAAGYKRIIVGEGRLAKKLSAYVGAGQPEVEYYGTSAPYVARDCYRPPVFVKGRSYMYGLSDGEMPDLSPCR
ncbi:MAG: hypothetical protein J0I98_07285 [Mesorhizobium sp.]|nr:hypothetical protein [Mesorhizobium sp.]MBN9242579.1 hypothetical protein [Mesorhizobium sp.]